MKTQNEFDYDGRKIRGYAIISKGDTPVKLARGVYRVPSQSEKGKSYVVLAHTHDRWQCECPDYQKHGIMCKHIHAIRFWLNIRDRINDNDFKPEIKTKKESCPYCSSDKIRKHGIRKNKNVEKQRFSCKACGKRFVLDIAKQTKGNGQIVTLCLDLYFKGISLRKIQDHLQQFYGFQITHMTIQRWIRKFMAMANQNAKLMQPKVSGLWHADEQIIKSNGSNLYVWNCMDAKTRFLIANNITEGREISDAKAVFQKAKEIAKPDVIVTDGLASYNKAIKKVFGWTNVEHIKADGLTSLKRNNNKIERFHNTFRERDKVMRGFKGQKNAQILTNAFQTYYNFVRPNTALGMTPAQKAGINFDSEKNKWLQLIEVKKTF
jgi:transposase-like protein